MVFMGLGRKWSQVLMGCLRRAWEAGKSCCGPKRFYAVVGGIVALLFVGVVLSIVVPLRLWADTTLVPSTAPPTTLQGNV